MINVQILVLPIQKLYKAMYAMEEKVTILHHELHERFSLNDHLQYLLGDKLAFRQI